MFNFPLDHRHDATHASTQTEETETDEKMRDLEKQIIQLQTQLISERETTASLRTTNAQVDN